MVGKVGRGKGGGTQHVHLVHLINIPPFTLNFKTTIGSSEYNSICKTNKNIKLIHITINTKHGLVFIAALWKFSCLFASRIIKRKIGGLDENSTIL